jgi:hypothetical protein
MRVAEKLHWKGLKACRAAVTLPNSWCALFLSEHALTSSKPEITLIHETLITNYKTWNYSINSMKVNIVIIY